jgi:hypothetical protein
MVPMVPIVPDVAGWLDDAHHEIVDPVLAAHGRLFAIGEWARLRLVAGSPNTAAEIAGRAANDEFLAVIKAARRWLDDHPCPTRIERIGTAMDEFVTYNDALAQLLSTLPSQNEAVDAYPRIQEALDRSNDAAAALTSAIDDLNGDREIS